MKKFYYLLTGFVFLFVIAFNTVVYAQYPTYKCGVKEGTELLWEVKVVDTTGLKETLGSNHSSKVTNNFGSIELGEKKKDKLENVYANKTQNLGLGSMNTFSIVTQIWDWTNTTFSSTPRNTISFSTFYDPEDVQALSEVNGREVSMWDWWFLNTSSVASHMRYLPIPAKDYLSDITWDTGHTVSGTTIIVKNAIMPLTPDFFITDYTAIFTFDSKFGIYNGFILLDDEENVIYELESKITVPTKSAILGYELAVFFSITSFAIICLIYIYTKKK